MKSLLQIFLDQKGQAARKGKNYENNKYRFFKHLTGISPEIISAQLSCGVHNHL
jgi:hypothetical protein